MRVNTSEDTSFLGIVSKCVNCIISQPQSFLIVPSCNGVERQCNRVYIFSRLGQLYRKLIVVGSIVVAAAAGTAVDICTAVWKRYISPLHITMSTITVSRKTLSPPRHMYRLTSVSIVIAKIHF